MRMTRSYFSNFTYILSFINFEYAKLLLLTFRRTHSFQNDFHLMRLSITFGAYFAFMANSMVSYYCC